MDQEKDQQFIAVETIIILPFKQRYCHYIVNEGEIHTKNYEELRCWLQTLVPSLTSPIGIRFADKKSFILYVKEKVLKDIEIKSGEDLQQTKEEHRNLNPEKIISKIEEKSVDTFDKFDKIFDKLSRLE